MIIPLIFIAIAVIFYHFSKRTTKVVQSEPIVKKTLPTLHLFFGSQTGTAFKFCQTIESLVSFPVKIHSLEDYSKMETYPYILVLTATHYEGDPPDNAVAFYKALSEAKSFKTRFGVFGLGNTSYKHYNRMGKEVDRLLELKGGQRWYPYGEGDDSCSLESDFDAWSANIEKVYKEVIERGDIEPQTSEVSKDNKSQTQNQQDMEKLQVEYEFHTKNFLACKQAKVISISELKKNPELGSCLEIIIDDTEYQMAGNIALYPRNAPEKVYNICKYLEVNPSDQVSWQSDKLPFPLPITYFEAIAQYCDIQGPIRKKALKDLAPLTESPVKDELKLLSGLKGQTRFQKEILDQKMTLFVLLQKYGIKVNFEQFVNMHSRIAPRYFTIASKPGQPLRILLSILKEENFIGLVSDYFQSKPKQVTFQKKESAFVLQPEKPKIAISHGAGIAPFMAFLQDKQQDFQLFFGCRSEGDFLYKEFLEAQEIDLQVSFSRSENKEYVQKGVLRAAEKVKESLLKGGVVYICGGMAMGRETLDVIEGIWKEQGGIAALEKEGRVVKELWG